MIEVFSLDLGKLLFVSLLFFSYFFLSLRSGKWFFYSALFLIFTLPFNITLQQPGFSAYVHGAYSNYLIPTLSLVDVFVFFLLLSSFKEIKKLKFSKPVLVFFVVFFLFLTLKAVIDWSLVSSIMVYRMFFYTFASCLLFSIFPFKKNIRLISVLIFFTVLIQLVLGFLQFRMGQSIGVSFLGESELVKGMYGTSFIDLNGELFLRAYGTFPHPNVLAGFLFFVVAFSVSFVKEKINIFTAVLATILVFLTFSRIVIFLVVLLWFLFFVVKAFSNKKLLSAFPLFFTRFFNLFLEKDSSFSDRIDLVEVSREIIQSHPYFGIGAAKFVYGLDLHPVYTAGGFLLLQPVHNVPLLILSEFGFLFGIPLIFLILYVLYRGFLQGGWLVRFVIFGLLFLFSFDHYFLTLPQGLMMLCLLMVFCSIPIIKKL